MADIRVAGRIAVSKAGRDKGRMFIIVGVFDEEHVLLADGGLRGIQRPKKKKLKHLAVMPDAASELCEALAKGACTDAMLRQALEKLRQQKGEQAQVKK